jgi:hypothetical protein
MTPRRGKVVLGQSAAGFPPTQLANAVGGALVIAAIAPHL